MPIKIKHLLWSQSKFAFILVRSDRAALCALIRAYCSLSAPMCKSNVIIDSTDGYT